MKVVLFHTNCTDGLFAAYAAWHKFGDDALYIPVNYKPIQDISATEALNYIFSEHTGKRVDEVGNSRYKVTDVTPDKYKDIDLYVVDYSFPVHHFLEHCSAFKSVTVLDHHEKAIRDYCDVFPHSDVQGTWKVLMPFDNAHLVFSEKESGAKLAWMYFHTDIEVPKVIELVSDRDLYTFNLQYTRPFHAGIRGLGEKNFAKLHHLVTMDLARVLDLGIHFEKATNSRIASTREANTQLIKIRIDGVDYKAAIVNSYPDIASDLCASLIKFYDCNLAISYNIHAGRNVGCSIRSNNEKAIVVGEHFGGGGHKNASGFHISLAELMNILTTGFLEI